MTTINELATPDSKSSVAAAEKIAAAIKKQFTVPVQVTAKEDGTAEVVVNKGYVASDDGGNKSVLTAKGLSNSIGDTFKQFRDKGWIFTQPVKGTFTIGVPKLSESQINEFTMNTPMISAGVMGVSGDVNAAPPPAEVETVSYPDDYTDVAPEESVVVGSPHNEHDPANITVYADKITPVTYSATNSAVAGFDIVFAVGVNCGDGVTKTYQVVKRIGLNKCKLACEAECSTPISIVEAKSAALKEAADAQKRRFRRLAGLE